MNNYNYFNDFYREYPQIGNKDYNTNLYSPTEGYLKGNLFSNLYSEYKNYRPQKLMARNEQEKLLYELESISFAAHELNLYLDLNPNDTSMLMLFKDYEEKCKKLTSEYENKYGPLSVSEVNSTKEFTWVNNWPWEVKNV